MDELTPRQEEILRFIEHHQRQNAYWPSIREIQERFGFKSTNAVMGHLRALERKGVLERIPGQARTFRLLGAGPAGEGGGHAPQAGHSSGRARNNHSEVVDIPILGDIAAGYPDRVEPAGEIGRLQVDARTAGNARHNRTFAIQVRGDSMVDAEIYEGDMVIVEPREPRNGDIVAALIDGETTLKRFMKKGDGPPYLKAENKFYPELYPVAELSIQGVAKAVVRDL